MACIQANMTAQQQATGRGSVPPQRRCRGWQAGPEAGVGGQKR